jgi:uncharacterized protein YdhG (YjbR/CyaY superfamily)
MVSGDGTSKRISTEKTAGKPAGVDEYIARFPEDVRERLEQIRRKVHELAPEAEEKISYDIPTFTLDGAYLVYAGGWRDYVSMYPIPAGDDAFEAAIQPFMAGKGTLRFPHKQPLPVPLIEQLIRLSIRSHEQRTKK